MRLGEGSGERPRLLVAAGQYNVQTTVCRSSPADLIKMCIRDSSWPGIGRLTIQAIANRDYYLVQGCILAIGLTYVAVNFLTDLLYSAVNPRIRQ